jgi:endoglucanase
MMCLMLSLIIIMSLVPVKAQAAPLVNPLPWLNVQGNRIVDESGTPVVLRGVAIQDQYHMYWTGLHRFDESNIIELVQNWHVNVIRVPIMPGLWYYPTYMQDILDPIVNWGNTHGTYILLGWHAHGNPITDQVEPSTLTDAPPYHGNPCDPNMTLATNFWDSVSERYKNDPWVIYSIFDEPAYITWKDWRPAAEQLVDVVRSHNPRALILVSGVDWAYDLREAKQNPVQRQNVVYEAHVYPLAIGHGPWDEYFGYLAGYYPVFVGEWGFQPGVPGLDATAESFGNPLVAYMARKNISWTGWIWGPEWGAPEMLTSYYVLTDFGQVVKEALSAPPATLAVKRRA